MGTNINLSNVYFSKAKAKAGIYRTHYILWSGKYRGPEANKEEDITTFRSWNLFVYFCTVNWKVLYKAMDGQGVMAWWALGQQQTNRLQRAELGQLSITFSETWPEHGQNPPPNTDLSNIRSSVRAEGPKTAQTEEKHTWGFADIMSGLALHCKYSLFK